MGGDREGEWVAGIDLSSFSVDVVKLPVAGEGGPRTFTYPLGKKGDAFDRARMVRDAMPDRFSPIWRDVVAIGIEEPWGRGTISTAAGYRVQGAILACLPPDTLVQPWAPATWKKAVGIGGAADKQRIMEFVMKRENRNRRSYGLTQDLADAYCIALATIGALA